MATLPPYSTYRTDPKQLMYPQQLSHGNILTFRPPGFKQTLNVKFPDSRLAVCYRCKKNYKTRDLCRVRNSHTSEPWTTAYICFTLDDNCTDENGKYVDKPFAVRMIQWQPYCVKKPFDGKTPVCSACKKTNRTRSFCRERHKHRQLPWCTVYVLLSPADTIDPSTRVAPEGTLVDNPNSGDSESQDDAKKADNEDEKQSDLNGQSKKSDPESKEGAPEEEKKTEGSTAEVNDESEGDDINDIAESRTFLAKISCKENSIHWLEMADLDIDAQISMHGVGMVATDPHMAYARAQPMPPHMDPAHSQYYAHHAMGAYATQPHQYHHLKANQQYFFQMQQRQHHQYAAHQAAWYNQQTQTQLVTQGQPPPPPPPAPGAPVTAGEAAAQQSKMSPSTAHATEPTTAGAAAAAAQQHQAYSQWQQAAAPPNQMAYHQQMYQSQLAHFQQAGGVLPHAAAPPPPTVQDSAVAPPAGHEHAHHGAAAPEQHTYEEQQHDAKRQRVV